MSGQVDLVKEAIKIASPYARHLGIFNPHKHQIRASVVGCGAIGSFVAVGLAKMGISQQVLFDMDKVEIENLPVQLHTRNGIGKNKAVQTAEMIGQMCPEDVEIITNEKWEGQPLKTHIVVSAVDDLAVRKAIWREVKYDSAVKLLVDARIGGQAMKIYSISPTDEKDIKEYDASLKSTKGSDLPCTERGVVDISLFASALLIRSVRRWISLGKKETYRLIDLTGEFPNIIG